MTLKRIQSISKHGIFRDFRWPLDLEEFKQFNLIYGWNGTGKSTIARILRCLEKREALTDGKVVLEISGQAVDGKDFAERTDQIRVFNKEFVAENVFTIDNRLSPIFVIGKENIDKQKDLDTSRAKVSDLRKRSARLKNDFAKAKKALDAHCTAQGKLVKEAIGGHGNRFANYNKANYTKKAAALIALETPVCARSSAERETLLTRSRSTIKAEIVQISPTPPDFGVLLNRAIDICKVELADNAIQKFATNAELAKWVGDGMAFHREPVTTCQFCDQEIPVTRKHALQSHFSDELRKLHSQIAAFVDEVEAVKSNLEDLSLPKLVEFFNDIVSNYSQLKEDVESLKVVWISNLAKLYAFVCSKKNDPFAVIQWSDDIEPASTIPLDQLCLLIDKHNQASRDFQSHVSSAMDSLEKEYAIDSIIDYKRLVDEADSAELASKECDKQLVSLLAKIKDLEVKIVSHREPAEKLNESLRKYLGHGDLRLEVSDIGYTISRGGTPAELLSEGERTAIALLYFLKHLDDRGFDKSAGTVVFDDPVSSLDGNALFNAFAYVKDQTRDIKQIVLLTHNYAFFRAVKQWFGNLRGANKREWRILMTQTCFDSVGRYSVIKEIDPLLSNFESEYHFLFSKILSIVEAPAATNLDEYLVAPTVARRVLESFLAFRVPGNGSLHSKLNALSCDDTVRSRIYRFVNTFSHNDSIGDGSEELSILSETQAVLVDLLALMKSEDSRHVDQMENCVRTTSTT